MRKRISYISLLFFWAGMSADAQVNITLSASTIQSGTAVTSTQAGGTYTPGLTLAPTILLSGSSPVLLQTATGLPFPITNLTIQLSSIGGVNLFGSSTPISLTTSPQRIFASGVSTGGAILLQFTIPVSGYAWLAGAYTTLLSYTLGTAGLGQSITNPGLLTVTVPAFITAPASIAGFTLNVNSLSDYSTATVGASSSLAYTTSVPYKIALKTNSGSLTYSNTYGMANPANLGVAGVTAAVNGGSGVALSATAQNLTTTPISVSGGNNQTQSLALSLAPAAASGQFVQAGSYTVPLTLTTSDASASPTAPTQTTTSTLTVNVADMQAFSVNDAVTTLNFGTAAAYSNGISQDQPNHLTVSSTTPWTLSVKAGSSTLSNGSATIPMNYVTVGNTSGQSILSSAVLSTASQVLAAAQAPAVGKTVGVNYSVSPANAVQLVSLVSGTYSATITYTLSAL